MDMGGSAGIGAGLGLLKGEFVDRPNQDRQNKLRAMTQLYSPWTHLNAMDVNVPNTSEFNNMLQGASQGAQFAQDNPTLMGGKKGESDDLSPGEEDQFQKAVKKGQSLGGSTKSASASPWSQIDPSMLAALLA